MYGKVSQMQPQMTLNLHLISSTKLRPNTRLTKAEYMQQESPMEVALPMCSPVTRLCLVALRPTPLSREPTTLTSYLVTQIQSDYHVIHHGLIFQSSRSTAAMTQLSHSTVASGRGNVCPPFQTSSNNGQKGTIWTATRLQTPPLLPTP